MSQHVMIDIETLSTSTDALILSIGAVKFDGSLARMPGHDPITDRFYVPVDPTTAFHLGGKIDPATVMWWMSTARNEAREQMMEEERIDLASALAGFADWFGAESLPVWGNGASFDNVILRSAFDRAGIVCPWKFYDDRCHRTLKALAPAIKPQRDGTYHNALDDAVYQVRQWSEVVAHLGLIL